MKTIITIAGLAFMLGCYAKGGVVHRLESGQTLTQLAHVYDVDLKSLIVANPRLHPDELKIGQKVLIPGRRELKTGLSDWEKTLDEPKSNLEPEENDEPETTEVVEIEETPQNKKEPVKTAVLPKKNIPVASPPGAVASSVQKAVPKKPEKKSEPLVQKEKTKGALPVLKLAWPGKGKIMSPYGMKNNKMHNGIDISLPPGSLIGASESGKVVFSDNSLEGYGNLVIVKHAGTLFTVYAYLGEVLVKKGTWVKKGDAIARVNTKKQDAFIHFEVRSGKKALDPSKHLSR